MTATARGTHRGANSNPTLEFWKVGNPSPCQFDWHRPSGIAASKITEHNSHSSGDRQRQQRKAGVKARAWVLCSASASPFGLRSSRTEYAQPQRLTGWAKTNRRSGPSQAKLPNSAEITGRKRGGDRRNLRAIALASRSRSAANTAESVGLARSLSHISPVAAHKWLLIAGKASGTKDSNHGWRNYGQSI